MLKSNLYLVTDTKDGECDFFSTNKTLVFADLILMDSKGETGGVVYRAKAPESGWTHDLLVGVVDLFSEGYVGPEGCDLDCIDAFLEMGGVHHWIGSTEA